MRNPSGVKWPPPYRQVGWGLPPTLGRSAHSWLQDTRATLPAKIYASTAVWYAALYDDEWIRRRDDPIMLTGDMLRRSAERFPNKAAILWQGASITFSELDAKANQLANRLLG